MNETRQKPFSRPGRSGPQERKERQEPLCELCELCVREDSSSMELLSLVAPAEPGRAVPGNGRLGQERSPLPSAGASSFRCELCGLSESDERA